ALCQQTGDTEGVRFAFDQLGIVADALGESETSRKYVIDSLKLGLELGVPGSIEMALFSAARHLLVTEDKPEQVVEIFAAFFSSLQDLNSTGEFHRRLETLKVELPPEVFDAVVRRGQASNFNFRAVAAHVLEHLSALEEPNQPQTQQHAGRGQAEPLSNREMD